jgi:hypothetical protein
MASPIKIAKESIMKNYLILNIMLLLIFSIQLDARTALCSDIPGRSEEVNQYIKMLTTGNLDEKIEAAKIIERSGFADQKLFDVIENELLKQYLVEGNSTQIDYTAWLCKALASSGMERYKPTLEKVLQSSNNEKIKKNAKHSLNLFDQYAERRKIISDDKYAIPGRDPDVVRLINMLKSDVMTLKRDAAKLISRNSYSDPDLYQVVNDELLQGYNKSDDDTAIDTMAWLCMALANSGDANYKKTLQTIVNTTEHRKLAKYASKALSLMN